MSIKGLMSNEKNTKSILSSGLLPLVLLTIIVRVVYWLQVRNDAWFIAPGMDPEYYLNWAHDILTGKGSLYLPFPRAPLYPYMLAATEALFGEGWLLPRLLNLGADIASTVLVFYAGRRVGGLKVARCAAFLYAVAGAVVYFSGEILMTSLATAAAIGLVYTLMMFLQKPSITRALISGVILAILSLLRPNALILLPLTIIVILIGVQRLRPGFKSLLLTSSSHLCALILLLAPVLIFNFQASGTIIPVSTQGGVNFYIGNAHNASGWSSELPGVGAAWSNTDASRIAKQDAGRSLAPVEVSRQLWRMGWREIKNDPGGWLGLILKKSVLLINAREIGNNRSMCLAYQSSLLLRILLLISIGTMLPFALLGIMYNYRNPDVRISLWFILTFGLSLVLFFVNTRYRMPLLPVFAVLSGAGLCMLWDAIRQRMHLIKYLIPMIVVYIITIPNWTGDDFNNQAQAHFVAGNALLRAGKTGEALERYRQAADINSDYPEMNLNTGVALLTLGDTLLAEEAFRKELENNPVCAKAENNLGVILESRGDIDQAQVHYLRAYHYNSDLEDARINAIRILLKTGDIHFQTGNLFQAEKDYAKAGELSESDPRPYYRLAIIEVSGGDLGAAVEHLHKALEIDPEYQPAREMLGRISNEGF